jgi:hypothetical protein
MSEHICKPSCHNPCLLDDERPSSSTPASPPTEPVSAAEMWKNWYLPTSAAKSTLKLRLWEARQIDEEVVKFAEAYAASVRAATDADSTDATMYHSRLTHLSFCITGNDNAFFTEHPEIDESLRRYRERVIEDYLDSAATDTEPTVEDGIGLLRKIEGCTSDAAKLILLKNFVLRSVRAASTGTGWIIVEKELPPANAAVLFWTTGGTWESGIFRADDDEPVRWECERTGPQDERIDFFEGQVTHWMIPALPVASQKGKEDKTVSNIPDLRLYECSWKNSLIRLWIPSNYTAEDIANIKEMWSMMIRQFERNAATVPPETTKPDHDLHNEACGCIPLPKPVLAKGFALTTPEAH